MYRKRQSLPRVSRAVSDPSNYQVLRSDLIIYPSNSLQIAFVLISQKCDNSVFNKHSSINFIKINFIVSKERSPAFCWIKLPRKPYNTTSRHLPRYNDVRNLSSFLTMMKLSERQYLAAFLESMITKHLQKLFTNLQFIIEHCFPVNNNQLLLSFDFRDKWLFSAFKKLLVCGHHVIYEERRVFRLVFSQKNF